MAGLPDGGGVFDLKSLERFSSQLNAQVAGEGQDIHTPFGTRRLVYADYTASGRALKPIESYVNEEVLPVYGNVHSLSTWTARQSSYFREEAREIARNFFKGTHEDAIIFAGNGATGAITLFLNIMHRQRWQIPKSDLRETRWHTFVCELCNNLQLDGEPAAKAHLNSKSHKDRAERMLKQKKTTKSSLVVFLVDPTLHHSTFLPFKELAAEDNCFKFEFLDTVNTFLDAESLKTKLNAVKLARDVWPDVRITVWCLINGCSNVTGCKAKVGEYNNLIHSFEDTYVLWDMASALGHMEIQLSPPENPLRKGDYIDVAVLSPHKLIGGPATSGLLCMKKSLLGGEKPGNVGGGVVRFVSRDIQLYSLHKEEREEAGTPNIVSCIRTGMVLKLASLIPQSLIIARESEHLRTLLTAWSRNKRVQILGPVIIPEVTAGNARVESLKEDLALVDKEYPLVRKSVVSIMIKYGNVLKPEALNQMARETVSPSTAVVSYANKRASGGLYLHHNFVCAVLNDVFGIQARPGCACAGPLSHDLLGMSPEVTNQYLRCLEDTGCEVLRPGYCRISIHYSMTVDQIELIAQAVNWIAQFGWKLLPYYTFNAETGEWTQNVVKPDRFRKWLSDMTISANEGIQWTTTNSQNQTTPCTATPIPKKDPRKLPGAVAMPGMNMDNLIAIKAALAKRQSKKLSEEDACKPAPLPRKSSVSNEAPKTKTVAEIRQMLERKSTQQPQGLDKLKSVKVLASKFEKPSTSTVERTKSSTNESVITSPQDQRRRSFTRATSNEPLIASTLPAATSPVTAPPVVDETIENCVVRDVEEARRTLNRSALMSAPEELQEYYDRANELIDGLKVGCGSSSTLAKLSRQGLCPPLPSEYAHLLWFALPGDAVYSLGLFGPEPNQGDPAICMSPADPGYPVWLSSNIHSNLPVERPVDSIFEVVPYEAKLLKEKDLRSSNPAVGDELLAWLNAKAETVSGVEEKLPSEPQDENEKPSINMRAGSNERLESEPKFEYVSSPQVTEENTVSASEDQLSTPCLRVMPPVPRILRRKIGEAIQQFNMIEQGDRILVGLSGGKDSLTMLHLLLDLQKRSPIKFEIGAATVNPVTLEYDPTPLLGYVRDTLKVPYHMLKYPIMDLAQEKMQGDSLCAFCARMKRGILYSCMRAGKYNKLALGQHMDDIAESFLMSAFYNGTLNTMKASYRTIVKDYQAGNGGLGNVEVLGDIPSSNVDDGTTSGPCTIHIIRPLVFIREKDLGSFAARNGLPVIADNCPACFKAPKERLRMKHLLAAQEFEHPSTLHNIRKAVMPLMAVDTAEKAVQDDDECAGMCPLNRHRSNSTRR